MSSANENAANPNKYCLVTEFDKKVENEKRKRLRLEQVRMQSKEIAQGIRNKVCMEKKKQLKRIEKTKLSELRRWHEKGVKQLQNEYDMGLCAVGEAHAAADAETAREEEYKMQKKNYAYLAELRGRDATKKLHQMKKLTPKKKRTKSTATQVGNEDFKKYVMDYLANDDERDGESKSLLKLSEDSKRHLKAGMTAIENMGRRRPAVLLPFRDPVIDEHFRSPRFSHLTNLDQMSDLDVNPVASKLNQARAKFESKEPIKEVPQKETAKAYNPNDFTAENSTSDSITLEPTKSIPQFNQVTELLKRKQSLQPSESYKSVRFTGSNICAPSEYPLLEPASNNPSSSKTSLITLFPSPSKLRTSQKSSTTASTTATKVPSTHTVEMYDHWTRFGKQYVPPGNLVRSEELQASEPSAMDLARLELEEDKKRAARLEELKKLDKIRSNQAMEKERVRKDRELLMSQLQTLAKDEKQLRPQLPLNSFSDENLRRMAEEREQKLNAAFEEILHKKTLITCPPVVDTTNTARSKKSSPYPTLNVAAPDEIDDSKALNTSDSFQTIILGSIDTDRLKLNKLQDLLDKIEEQRQMLTQEIEKEKILSTDTRDQALKSIQNFDCERNLRIVTGAASARKQTGKENNELEREKLLLKKRERKLREKEIMFERKLMELEKTEKRHDGVPLMVTKENAIEGPVKILIHVENEDKIKITRGGETAIIPESTTVADNFKRPMDPKSVKKPVVRSKPRRDETTFESTSTAYRSPPSEMHTKFGDILRQPLQNRFEKSKPPDLSHYINKLLGMSRTSINNLPSTDVSLVSTPSDSVINNTANISIEEIPSIDPERMQRLKYFINESHSIADEVDKSLSRTGADDESIEGIRRLIEQAKAKKRMRKTEEAKKDAQKKVPEGAQKKTEQISSPINYDEELMSKYNLLTENCSKRISELAGLIAKVRSEKHRLAETNSFSSSGGQIHSTEYLDLPNTGGTATEPLATTNRTAAATIAAVASKQIISDRNTVPITERRRNLAASCDSGLGVSRPVTSSDVVGSPDIRPLSGQLNFDPITTEIVKTLPIKLNAECSENKPDKPPISLGRHSPRVDQLHELSTIAEVETPATSKINTSIPKLLAKSVVEIGYEKFPSYSDYLKKSEGRLSKSATSDGSTIPPELLNITGMSDLDYLKFSQKSPNSIRNNNTNILTSSRSDSSLPDVVAELKRRHIIDHSFEKLPASPTPIADVLVGMTNTSQIIEQSEFTKSSKTTSKKTLSKSTKVPSSLSGITALSSDSESTFKGLEKDLSKMGLDWASTMLKKNERAKALSPSSSSSPNTDPRLPPSAHTTENSKYSSNDSSPLQGGSICLKEFLSRELKKRTSSDSSSEPSTLASMYLKSLLSVSSSSHHEATADKSARRTSTPNTRTVVSEDISKTLDVTSPIFSAESRLSSVRMCSSDGEPLDVPEVKLDVDKYKKSASD